MRMGSSLGAKNGNTSTRMTTSTRCPFFMGAIFVIPTPSACPSGSPSPASQEEGGGFTSFSLALSPLLSLSPPPPSPFQEGSGSEGEGASAIKYATRIKRPPATAPQRHRHRLPAVVLSPRSDMPIIPHSVLKQGYVKEVPKPKKKFN
jgi:hypothetical protein